MKTRNISLVCLLLCVVIAGFSYSEGEHKCIPVLFDTIEFFLVRGQDSTLTPLSGFEYPLAATHKDGLNWCSMPLLSDQLYPKWDDDKAKYGYANLDGTYSVNPKFDVALPFSEGRATVAIGKDYGVISTTGEIIVPFGKYRSIAEFSDGMAAVMDFDQQIGYITSNGEEAIPCRFAPVFEPFQAWEIPSFSEGVTVVRDKEDGNLAFIDREGNRLNIPGNPESLFCCGYATVSFADGKNFVNKAGRLLLKDSVPDAGVFREDVAWILSSNNIYTFIDKNGDRVFSLDKGTVPQGGFSDGLCCVKKGENEYSYISHDGKEVLKHFRTATEFHHGKAYVTKGELSGMLLSNGAFFPGVRDVSLIAHGAIMIGKGERFRRRITPAPSNVMIVYAERGYLDPAKKYGLVLGHIPSDIVSWESPEADALLPKRDEVSRKWGYVDAADTWIINPQYEFAFPFIGKYAVCVYGNIQDNLLVPEKRIIISKHAKSLYESSQPLVVFRGDVFFELGGGQLGFTAISIEGRDLGKRAYSDFRPFSEDRAFVKVLGSSKFKMIDKDLKEIGLREYEDSRIFSDGLCAVMDEKKWGYVDASGKEVVECKYERAYEFVKGVAVVIEPGDSAKRSFLIDMHGKIVSEKLSRISIPWISAQFDNIDILRSYTFIIDK